MTIGAAEPRRRQPAEGPGAGDHVQLPAPERPGLELRRRQLPEGRDAAAVRPALLEQRRHQPARADVLLVPAQHLPREQPGRARQARRCAARRSTSAGSACRPTSTPRARTTSCRGRAPIAARQVLRGKRRFVLGASGHIAGVINPPRRRSAATGSAGAPHCRPSADAWFGDADRASGQLVDRLVGLARAVRRQAGRRAEEAGHARSTRRSSRRPAATSRRRPERVALRPLVDSSTITGDPMSTDIVIVAAARTAVGKFGGALAKTPAPELGAAVIANLLERARLSRRPDRRGHPRPGADRRLGPEPGAPDGRSRAACRRACRR